MEVLQQNLLVLLSYPLGACVIISNDDSDEVEDVCGESILKQSRKGTPLRWIQIDNIIYKLYRRYKDEQPWCFIMSPKQNPTILHKLSKYQHTPV
jgi:hypothetical protein